MNKPILFDLDDFSNDNNVLSRLSELKIILPKLKVNLFTIPNKTSVELLEEASSKDWISLIPHSFKHNDDYECAKMTYVKALRKLEVLDMKYYARGFKPAGWQISTQVMRALKDLGFWLAVQWSDDRMNGDPNGPNQPAVIDGLRFYSLNEQTEYKTMHGHCQNVCGNGLEQIWEDLIKINPDDEFEFIKNTVWSYE